MSAWPNVKLGEVLRRSDESFQPTAATEYREITVKLWGKGVVERGRSLGASMSGRRFVARTGQFIASRIDARNGAMGLVPADLDGALVTNDFPLFDLRADKLVPAYFGWLSKTAGFVELCLKASEGTTNRVRLKEERFLALEISLPPLAEQRRVVARIDGIAAQVREACALRHQVMDELASLLRAIIRSGPTTPTPMRELVTLRSPDVIVDPSETYQFAGVYSFGRGVFKSVLKMGVEFAYPRLSRLRAGDFVYPKLMAWEGAFGVTPHECDGLVVSTEFPVFEVNRDRVLPEVLDVHFRDPSVWEDVAGGSIGTNARRRRLNPVDLLGYKFPLPNRARQEQLAKVWGELEVLKRLQTETTAEIGALLPAVLDRAFKGRL